MTIAALKLRRAPAADFPRRFGRRVAGLDFPSPVGLAAGFDKDAEVPEQMLALGFGFVEVGTLTPRPQEGNPRPRLFRLQEDRAVINRMGFNNRGQPAAFERLRECAHAHGVIGVNVGANKDSADRIADYVAGVRAMAPVARYLTINISSPNTPGLRELQDEGALEELLAAVAGGARARTADLSQGRAGPRARATPSDRAGRDRPRHRRARSSPTRPCRGRRCKSRFAGEAGGLSGAPLKPLALDALARIPRGERRRNPADRRRRDRQRRRRLGADPRRREPGPAVHGDGL